MSQTTPAALLQYFGLLVAVSTNNQTPDVHATGCLKSRAASGKMLERLIKTPSLIASALLYVWIASKS